MQAAEAEAETLQMLGIYEELATKIAAMPVIAGRKSRIESFAGANCTYTIEAMMGDKRALQVLACTVFRSPDLCFTALLLGYALSSTDY